MRLTSLSPADSFDRVFTGHFYGHLEEPQRERFLLQMGDVFRLGWSWFGGSETAE